MVRGSLRAPAFALSVLLALTLWIGAPPPAVARDVWWGGGPRATVVATQPAADAVSAELAFTHVAALADKIGPRPAAGPGFRQAVGYAREYLEGLGYEVTLEDFAYEHWEDLGSTLRLDAEGGVARGFAMRGSPARSVDGELVDVGLGRAADLAGIRLDGKIALARRGDIPFGGKAEQAQAAGAVGLVVYNSEAGDLHGLLDRESTIPVLGLSGAEGARLLRRVDTGAVGARLEVRVAEGTRTSSNVIAHGGKPGAPGQVIVGGHLDSVSVSPGANDNASGSAVVLELARVFAGRPEMPGLTFALFGAEEDGLWGSRRHVERLGDETSRRYQAMINLDMVSVGDRFEVGGTGAQSRDLAERALAAARAAGTGQRVFSFDPGGASDHAPFAGAGVPVVMIHWRGDPNYHQPTDTPDEIDREKLAASARTVARLIEDLLTG